MIEWLRAGAVAEHRIDEGDLAGLRVTSDPQEIVRVVTAARQRQREGIRGRG